MTGRTLLPVIFFVLSVFLDASWARTESDLVRVRVDESSHVIGEIQRETDTQIDLVDLKTGTMRRFKKAEIDSVENATENYAISVVGLPHFVAWKIEKHLPPRAAIGKIAAMDGTNVFVTLGSNHRVSEGQELGVFRGTKEIRDPDTGEVLGKQERRVAALKVVRVEEKFCKAELDGELDVELHVGDVVKGNEGSDAVAVLPVIGGDGDESVDARRMVEKITTGLVNRDIPIVERRLLDTASDELSEQQDKDVFDPSTAQSVGKRVGAFAVLVGTITPENKYSRVQMRLVEVETGKVLAALSHILQGTSSDVASDTEDRSGKTERERKARAGAPSIVPFHAAMAQKVQKRWAEYLGVDQEFTNSIGMKFVFIPPGQFMMGSDEGVHGGREGEYPKHRVRITRPFYLGIHEVTQDQWQKVKSKNPAEADHPERPVGAVSWDEAQFFCLELSRMDEEYHYRLPTEAEWEYACLAGMDARFFFGNSKHHEDVKAFMWYRKNTVMAGESYAHRVGQKKPNAFGLYDMHGNVIEWCQDWYNKDYYSVSPIDDPKGPDNGSKRVCRGGAYANWWLPCNARNRGTNHKGPIGFRVVAVPEEWSDE